MIVTTNTVAVMAALAASTQAFTHLSGLKNSFADKRSVLKMSSDGGDELVLNKYSR